MLVLISGLCDWESKDNSGLYLINLLFLWKTKVRLKPLPKLEFNQRSRSTINGKDGLPWWSAVKNPPPCKSMADSCQCMTKTLQYCKVISLQLIKINEKNPPADAGSIPEFGRSLGERNGNLLQYSCLGSPMDWGAWWAAMI